MLPVELQTVKALDDAHRAQYVNHLKPAGPPLWPAAGLRQAAPGNQAPGQPPVMHSAPSACIRVHLLKSA